MAGININGDRFECFEEGSGEPVVFVHGSASDYRTWQFQRGEFARRYRVVVYSRRYHWPNDPIAEGRDYAMGEQVEDLQMLIHRLEASPAHLVGHSYGAFLCLLLAIRSPHNVRSLVLAEPPVITLFTSNPPKLAEILKLLATRPRTAAAIVKFGARGVMPATKAFKKGDVEKGMRIFGDAVFGPGGFDRLPTDRKAQVRDNLSNVRAELLGSGFLPLDPGKIRSVRIPALLVTGQNSVGLFHRLTEGLEALLPDAERVEIPGASHMMHEDNADGYNKAVLSFLEKHRVAE